MRAYFIFGSSPTTKVCGHLNYHMSRVRRLFYTRARARGARARVTVSLKGLAARGHLNTLQLLVIW